MIDTKLFHPVCSFFIFLWIVGIHVVMKILINVANKSTGGLSENLSADSLLKDAEMLSTECSLRILPLV